MTANVDAMVRAGVEAYRAGNKPEARALLERALELDEYNEQAWLWLSAAVETPEEQRTCLENVLVINPNNERARMGLKSLGVDPSAKAAAAPAPAPATPPSAPAFSSTEWGDDDDDIPPTASSSASSTSFRGATHDKSDLDDWVSGLGIGGKKPAPAMPSTSFTDDSDSDPFGRLDDLDNLFGSDDDEIVSARSASGTPALSDDFEMALDDPFEELELEDDELTSDVLADFDAAVNTGIEQSNVDEFIDDISLADDILNEDSEEESEPDLQHFFLMIPKEIEASRLPGENEANPTLLLAGVGVLAVLNVVGLLFFVSSMAG
jgi:hypothetical protein